MGFGSEKTKVRFCKMCGSQINSETKKCSGCGKQYFKGIKFNKFFTMTFILSIVMLISVILNIVQFVKMNELSKDKKYYKRYLNFYEKHTAIVSDDGSKKYHIYGCDDLDTSSFLIYNCNASVVKGYSACSKCNKKTKSQLALEKLRQEYGLKDEYNHR